MNLNDEFSRNTGEGPVSAEHPNIFHYTSICALEGILETNTLWATQATYLNDSSEMTILWPVLKEKCIEFLADAMSEYLLIDSEARRRFETLGGIEKFANQDGHMIVDVMRQLMFGNSDRPGIGIPFVVSFTTHENEYSRQHGMLSQWNSYGGKDNIAIVFDTVKIENLLRSEVTRFTYLSCSISNAIYHREGLDLVECFPILFREVEKFCHQVVNLLSDEDSASQESLEALSTVLLPAVGRLKHQAFHEEKECRIVVGIPDKHYRPQLEKLGNKEVLIKEVLYRSASNGPTPYIHLFEELDEQIPITRILIGPSSNQNSTQQRARELTDRFCGELKIKIDCSDIPLVRGRTGQPFG